MLSLFLANVFGWVVAHWKLVAGAVVVFLVFILFTLTLRSCNKPPKLDQKEIIKAQQAIAEQDRKQMIEVLAESTVKEQGIDNSIKAAEEATEKAKQDYSKLSNDELAQELQRRLEESK